MKTKIIYFILTLTIISSCATYKAQYRDEDYTLGELPNKPIEKTFYLLGDAGKSPFNQISDGLKAFNSHIKNKNTEGDYLLYLGDNIYPAGLPKKNHKGRKYAEHNLDVQIESANKFKGTTIFIPGNHDWYADGVDGVKRQEKYVEKALGKNTFLPEDGCPIERVEVNDKIRLIIIDTQWYIENWNHHPTINDDCEIKTRDRFFEEIEG
ncbi:MAG TPA: metallophosphoesterase family protein, partial [Flavobacteriaceae bacterium]|nr:metallophosphoesterase family protein [Flavobacteriaceae bacterium]